MRLHAFSFAKLGWCIAGCFPGQCVLGALYQLQAPSSYPCSIGRSGCVMNIVMGCFGEGSWVTRALQPDDVGNPVFGLVRYAVCLKAKAGPFKTCRLGGPWPDVNKVSLTYSWSISCCVEDGTLPRNDQISWLTKQNVQELDRLSQSWSQHPLTNLYRPCERVFDLRRDF